LGSSPAASKGLSKTKMENSQSELLSDVIHSLSLQHQCKNSFSTTSFCAGKKSETESKAVTLIEPHKVFLFSGSLQFSKGSSLTTFTRTPLMHSSGSAFVV